MAAAHYPGGLRPHPPGLRPGPRPSSEMPRQVKTGAAAGGHLLAGRGTGATEPPPRSRAPPASQAMTLRVTLAQPGNPRRKSGCPTRRCPRPGGGPGRAEPATRRGSWTAQLDRCSIKQKRKNDQTVVPPCGGTVEDNGHPDQSIWGESSLHQTRGAPPPGRWRSPPWVRWARRRGCCGWRRAARPRTSRCICCSAPAWTLKALMPWSRRCWCRCWTMTWRGMKRWRGCGGSRWSARRGAAWCLCTAWSRRSLWISFRRWRRRPGGGLPRRWLRPRCRATRRTRGAGRCSRCCCRTPRPRWTRPATACTSWPGTWAKAAATPRRWPCSSRSCTPGRKPGAPSTPTR